MTSARPHARVWDQLCRHIDGLAVGSTVRALQLHGAMPRLASGQPVDAAGLAADLGARPGHLHVALRLLADQGWLTPHPGPESLDTLAYTATPLGRRLLAELAPYYTVTAPLLALGQRMASLLFGPHDPAAEQEFGRLRDLMRAEWHLPRDTRPVHARLQVIAHLDGHLVAPLMAHLVHSQVLHPRTSIPLRPEKAPADAGALRIACDILVYLGWATVDGDEARLTERGALAASYARQYWHPVSYLPLFRDVPRLLFGGREAGTAAASEDDHLDRALDITFSGDVFTATCEEPFLDMALPLFDTGSVPEQPTAVVDAGCGDGTVLHALYTAVRDRTERGRQLVRRPLLMVGVEPSPVARRAAADRLAAAGIPHLVLDGDITLPGSIAAALTAHGVDATDALHVSKSVVHDRNYTRSGRREGTPPPSTRFFTTPDGEAIPPGELAQNLVDHFRRWRPLTRRHGMLVIEAHATDPVSAAGLMGRTLATSFDATHGYSGQLPVEQEVFAWAARTAGFRSVRHRDLGAGLLGHTALTIDHFTSRKD